MKEFLLPLVNQDTTWITVIASIFPIIFTAYGVFFFWPHFTKQKRIENISLVAKEALRILSQLENSFFKAMWLHSHQVKLNGKKDEVIASKNDDALHIEIWGILNDLRTSLLLLRNDADFKNIPDITHLTKWVESLERMLQHGNYDVQLSMLTLELFEKIDPEWTKKDTSFNPLDKLRNILLTIYEYRNPRFGSRNHIFGS